MSIIRDKFRYIFIYKCGYYLGTKNSAFFSPFLTTGYLSCVLMIRLANEGVCSSIAVIITPFCELAAWM